MTDHRHELRVARMRVALTATSALLDEHGLVPRDEGARWISRRPFSRRIDGMLVPLEVLSTIKGSPFACSSGVARSRFRAFRDAGGTIDLPATRSGFSTPMALVDFGFDREQPPKSRIVPTMPRPSRLHLLVLTPTLLLTIAASWYPSLFITLRRDPEALLRGELWRLLSPVLIQADALQDGGWWRLAVVLVMVAVVIIVGERAFGARRCLLLYGLGALVGHGVGAFWDPYGSGCSVAGCGILGGIAGWLLRARPLRVKLGAALWLGLGAVATWVRDIHGPPLLAGALAAAWLARSVPLPPQLSQTPGGADST